MSVERTAMPGTSERRRSRISRTCSELTPRFIARSMFVLMCWIGMSRYFTTFGCSRIRVVSSWLTVCGYAYMRRTHSMPSTSASLAISSWMSRLRAKSRPYAVLSSATTTSSLMPAAARPWASSTSTSMGLLRLRPRILGMAQKVHLWSQPSLMRR